MVSDPSQTSSKETYPVLASGRMIEVHAVDRGRRRRAHHVPVCAFTHAIEASFETLWFQIAQREWDVHPISALTWYPVCPEMQPCHTTNRSAKALCNVRDVARTLSAMLPQ